MRRATGGNQIPNAFACMFKDTDDLKEMEVEGTFWVLVPVTRHWFYSLDLFGGEGRGAEDEERRDTLRINALLFSHHIIPFIIHPSPVISPAARWVATDASVCDMMNTYHIHPERSR